VESSCEHANELPGSKKCWEILEQLSDWRTVKKLSSYSAALRGLTCPPCITSGKENRDHRREELVTVSTGMHVCEQLPSNGQRSIPLFRFSSGAYRTVAYSSQYVPIQHTNFPEIYPNYISTSETEMLDSFVFMCVLCISLPYIAVHHNTTINNQLKTVLSEKSVFMLSCWFLARFVFRP
jgi:hypothetical protein